MFFSRRRRRRIVSSAFIRLNDVVLDDFKGVKSDKSTLRAQDGRDIDAALNATAGIAGEKNQITVCLDANPTLVVSADGALTFRPATPEEVLKFRSVHASDPPTSRTKQKAKRVRRKRKGGVLGATG